MDSVLPEAGLLRECAWLVLFLLSLHPDWLQRLPPLKASVQTKQGKTGSSNLQAAPEVHVGGHDWRGAHPARRGEFPREGMPRFLQLDGGPGLGGPPGEGSWFPELAYILQPVTSPRTELPPPAAQPVPRLRVCLPGTAGSRDRGCLRPLHPGPLRSRCS